MRSFSETEREAAEHDRMDRADAGAGLHRNHGLRDQRHVDHDAIAALDAELRKGHSAKRQTSASRSR